MVNTSHYHFNKTVSIRYAVMKDWVTNLFYAQGMNEADAEVVADSLVDSDARGVYSHGTQRVKMYSERIRRNCVNVTGKPYVVVDRDATAVVDGDNGMGQIVGVFAMNLAIEKAKQYGVSFVTARGSNHYGRCEYYTRMALNHDMAGFSATVGGGNLMAPWGGSEARVGNNPFSIAMPAEERYPVVLDMAQSVVAKGKIEMALKTGSTIPKEWALDKNGIPTTNPSEGSEGSVRPIADYKGADLAIMIGFMSSLFCGGAVGPTLKNVYKDFDGGLNKGQMFMAIDISRMIDVAIYKERMKEQIDFIKETPRAMGVDEVLMPGEQEYQYFDRQIKDGIVYAVEVIAELKEMSKQLGVEIPEEI